jgi:CRP-like cAMP-binding protein
MTFSDRSALQTFVDRLNRRSSLAGEEAAAILSLPATPAQVRANRDFVSMGEETDHACLIVEGLVGRFGQTKGGARQITAMHIPGDMADLHSVVVPKAGSALQALSTTTILRIPHRSIRAIAHEYPSVAEAFWRECVVDAAILSQWVVNVGRRDALARTAHLLCEMALRYQEIGRAAGLSFDFPATQMQLADCLGLTAVHVNRTLKAMKETGVVRVVRHTVQIVDWPRLTEIGDFDPVYLQIPSPADKNGLSSAWGAFPRLAAE